LVCHWVPSMRVTRRCKSSGEPGRREPERTARRPSARPALKEAGSEAAGRRTGTGHEAATPRASGQLTAKPSRPRGGDVNPATVRRRPWLLPGEVSHHARKGDAARRSEKSAEVVVAPV